MESYDFFLKSKLPESELAKIWDFVASKKSGHINKDGFISAMHLIKLKMDNPSFNIPHISLSNSTEAPQAVDLLDLSVESLPATESVVHKPPMDSVSSIAPLSSSAHALAKGSNIAVNTTPEAIYLQSTVAAPIGFSSSDSPSSVKKVKATSERIKIETLPVNNSVKPHNFQSVEISGIAELSVDLNARKKEVEILQEQLQKLAPSYDDLCKKRQAVEKEFKDASEQRNKLTVELSQKRAMFESESATLAETMKRLEREKQTIEAAKTELEHYQHVYDAVMEEKTALFASRDSANSEVSEYKSKIAAIIEETSALKTSLVQIKADMQKKHRLADVNNSQLAQAQETYRQVKLEHDTKKEKLDVLQKKTQQFQQQISVQNEIIRKEKQKLAQLDDMIKREINRNQSLEEELFELSKEADKVASDTARKEADSKLLIEDDKNFTNSKNREADLASINSKGSKDMKSFDTCSIKSQNYIHSGANVASSIQSDVNNTKEEIMAESKALGIDIEVSSLPSKPGSFVPPRDDSLFVKPFPVKDSPSDFTNNESFKDPLIYGSEGMNAKVSSVDLAEGTSAVGSGKIEKRSITKKFAGLFRIGKKNSFTDLSIIPAAKTTSNPELTNVSIAKTPSLAVEDVQNTVSSSFSAPISSIENIFPSNDIAVEELNSNMNEKDTAPVNFDANFEYFFNKQELLTQTGKIPSKSINSNQEFGSSKSENAALDADFNEIVSQNHSSIDKKGIEINSFDIAEEMGKGFGGKTVIRGDNYKANLDPSVIQKTQRLTSDDVFKFDDSFSNPSKIIAGPGNISKTEANLAGSNIPLTKNSKALDLDDAFGGYLESKPGDFNSSDFNGNPFGGDAGFGSDPFNPANFQSQSSNPEAAGILPEVKQLMEMGFAESKFYHLM